MLHATNLRIPIVEVEGGSLTALAGFDGHQGVALVVEPRRFASLDDVLARAAERDEPPFILVLDSLEDPHNVGTLLRSAEAAGVHGVLFPTHRQAPLSPSAVKASAGAIEHLLLCPVDDLPGALSDLHTRGVRIAGAEGDAPMTARQSDLRGPLAIVVGSEGQGLGPAVRRRADLFMRIPMKGAVGSLNAAVAGSILLFEALAQRDPNATPRVIPTLGDPSHDEVARANTTQKARGRKGRPTEPDDVLPDALDDGEAAVPPEPTPKPRGRKGLSTEPDNPPPAGSKEADPARAADENDAAAPSETTPKRRARKSLSTESDLALPAGSDEATATETRPKARTRKSPAPEPKAASAGSDDAAASAVAKPRSARRKPRAPEPAAPTDPAAGSPEDDLLPADGAAKGSSPGR